MDTAGNAVGKFHNDCAHARPPIRALAAVVNVSISEQLLLLCFADVFAGGMLCMRVALAMWTHPFVVRVRAGGEVVALPRLAFYNIIYSMPSINNIGKKKGRGRPATGATPVLVRVPPEILKALDGWIKKQEEAQTRPQGILRLVELGLKKGK
jgi:hypothetical protein